MNFSLFRNAMPQWPMHTVDVAVRSMPADRPVNEDFVGVTELKGRKLFALADGLGGHGMGDEASRLVVETAAEQLDGETEPLELLSRCFEKAQQRVMEKQRKAGNSQAMKTTMNLALLEGDRLWYGHVGDSRFYYFKNKQFALRTMDHSVPQMLASSGQIREKDIRGHEDRNRLLRVIGIEWSEPKYELAAEPLRLMAGDAVLLCSDGFWELIEEKQMVHLLRSAESAEQWLSTMEQLVLQNGKGKRMDNYSAIAVLAR